MRAGPTTSNTRRAVLALLLLPLAACGFHPLDGEYAQGIDEPELAAIKVAPIRDRIGQQLEWALREELNPRGVSAESRYTLLVSLSITRTDLGLQRDASATRGRIDALAQFSLLDHAGKSIYSSHTQSVSAFNIVNDAYASQVAEDDARTRTVRDLSEEIRTRLALFLRQRRAG